MTHQLLSSLAQRLWPINRSLTGDGVRETHRILSEIVPLRTFEIPSGTPCLDWTIPPEWKVREAYIVAPDGRRLFDIAENNLRLVGYSTPIRTTLPLAELKRHLHTIPEMPDAIPYVTRYYKREWGFCITHNELIGLTEGDYQVVIDSELFDGSMTISDCVLAGESKREILVHTYTCHPSLAINELSGPLVAIELLRRLADRPSRRYSYRFVFAPETIGAIAYLDRFGDDLKANLAAGFICTCVGHDAGYVYKRSRLADSLANRATENAFATGTRGSLDVRPYSPSGSDERQYCSIGFDLPVGSLMRTPYHEYPEYHTSLDNLELMKIDALYETVEAYLDVFEVIEANETFRVKITAGEPFLSKYGNFYFTSGHRFASDFTRAVKWLVHFCDGSADLISISQQSGISTPALREAADALQAAGLLERVS